MQSLHRTKRFACGDSLCLAGDTITHGCSQWKPPCGTAVGLPWCRLERTELRQSHTFGGGGKRREEGQLPSARGSGLAQDHAGSKGLKVQQELTNKCPPFTN